MRGAIDSCEITSIRSRSSEINESDSDDYDSSKVHKSARFLKKNVSELDTDDLSMLSLAITKELIDRLEE